MAARYRTREDIQSELEKSGYEVSYLDREPDPTNPSPDNWIVYMPIANRGSLRADDMVHMRRLTVQVVHLHKKKLDSIAPLMLTSFNTEPTSYAAPKDTNTDYWSTYYEVDILTGGQW